MTLDLVVTRPRRFGIAQFLDDTNRRTPARHASLAARRARAAPACATYAATSRASAECRRRRGKRPAIGRVTETQMPRICILDRRGWRSPAPALAIGAPLTPGALNMSRWLSGAPRAGRRPIEECPTCAPEPEGVQPSRRGRSLVA